MDDYQELVRKLALINEGASIITLDVSAASNDAQQIKSVLVGISLSSGAQISATFQAPCFETLLDALETFFSVQNQVIEQAMDQVNVMASTGDDMDMGGPAGDVEFMSPDIDPAAMGGDDMGGDMMATVDPEPEDDEYSFAIGSDAEEQPEIVPDDVVVDTDELEPEIGDDVKVDDARYSHNYSFRNKGSGLFQSLTGQQRIQKGALRTAKKRLGQ